MKLTAQHLISISCFIFLTVITLFSVICLITLDTEGRVRVKRSLENKSSSESDREKWTEGLRFVRPQIKSTELPSRRLNLEELQCPPPPVTRSLSICRLKHCSNNNECSEGKACCFNGCVRTCVDALAHPAAFDWIEDTSKILPILSSNFDEFLPSQFVPVLVSPSTPVYEAAEAGEELVYLAGGCLVSASQHTKLKKFAESPNIKQCRCQDREVVCDVSSIKS